MQFIDVNCMIGEWGYKNLRFKTAEGLSAEMNRLGIWKALAFESRAWLYDSKAGNDMIAQEALNCDNIIPVMTLTPLIEYEYGGKGVILDFMRRNRIGAVRLFPSSHNYTLQLWNANTLCSLLDEAGMPALIDCRDLEDRMEHAYPEISEIANTFKNLPIILLTVGYRCLRVIYKLFEKHHNIYIDTSTFITFHGIEDIVKHFGSGRIIFGSRMPFIEAGVSIGRIIYADIDQKDKENIAYGNIYNILQNNKLFH